MRHARRLQVDQRSLDFQDIIVDGRTQTAATAAASTTPQHRTPHQLLMQDNSAAAGQPTDRGWRCSSNVQTLHRLIAVCVRARAHADSTCCMPAPAHRRPTAAACATPTG